MGVSVSYDLVDILQAAGVLPITGQFSGYSEGLPDSQAEAIGISEYGILPTQTSGSYDEFYTRVQLTARCFPSNYLLLRQKLRDITLYLIGINNVTYGAHIYREVSVITAPIKIGSMDHQGKEMFYFSGNFRVVRGDV